MEEGIKTILTDITEKTQKVKTGKKSAITKMLIPAIWLKNKLESKISNKKYSVVISSLVNNNCKYYGEYDLIVCRKNSKENTLYPPR